MRFKLGAVGGTFDIIHKGHIKLLERAFSESEYIIVGISSDEFAFKRGKTLIHTYEERLNKLKNILERRYRGRYTIIRLDDEFGPTLDRGEIEVLFVSKETEYKAHQLNMLRRKNGLKELSIISIDMILADDGKPISTSRIRRGEIDTNGNILLF